MNDAAIITTIALCSQWWPSWHAPESIESMTRAWRPLLGDLDEQAVTAALLEYATSGAAFPPAVGQLRRRAVELATPAGKAPTVDAAWGEVLSMIARVGYTIELRHPERPVLVWSHPSIERVVNAMGWGEMCRSENQIADRAHFSKMYAERVERDVSVAAAAPAVKELRRSQMAAIGEGG